MCGMKEQCEGKAEEGTWFVIENWNESRWLTLKKDLVEKEKKNYSKLIGINWAERCTKTTFKKTEWTNEEELKWWSTHGSDPSDIQLLLKKRKLYEKIKIYIILEEIEEVSLKRVEKHEKTNTIIITIGQCWVLVVVTTLGCWNARTTTPSPPPWSPRSAPCSRHGWRSCWVPFLLLFMLLRDGWAQFKEEEEEWQDLYKFTRKEEKWRN